LRRRRFTNRQAFRQIFWEHSLFPGNLEAFRFWVSGPGGPGVFEQENMAQRTLAAMQDEREREAVERGNRKLFAGRLTPGIDLLWPNAPEGIEDGFAALSAWFGMPRAAMVRLGKDLKRYGGEPALLAERADWLAEDGTHPSWRMAGGAAPFTVRMQPFPNDHLYRLEVLGRAIWEFDDWPANWARNWPDPNKGQ
jgi:hypothetical protein